MVISRPLGSDRLLRLGPVVAARRGVAAVTATAGRLVTRLGAAVGFLAVAAWIAGWLLGWAELMVLAASSFLLLLLSVGFVVGRMSFRVGIRLEPCRVVVGERAAGSVRVENTSRSRTLSLAVTVPVGSDVAGFRVPSLAGGASHDELFVVPTRRRAVITVGPATLVRADPVGLLSRRAALTDTTELFVHPVTVPMSSMAAGILRDLEGHETNTTVMSDLAFHSLREYEPGDPIRNVHWRTTARTGRLMIRQFVDTRRSHVLVLVDARTASYGAPEDFELAVSAAGSVAGRAIADKQQLSMIAGARTVADGDRRRVLDALSGVDLAETSADLVRLCGRGAHAAHDATLVLLVTGSAVRPESLLPPLRRFSVNVKALALRVDPWSPAAVQQIGGLTVMRLAALTDLSRLLSRAVDV